MALDIVAWHDRTSSDHQTQYNNARAAGYSTVSLCVYGDPGSPLYAAAMVKRATQTAEQHFPSLNGTTLQATFDAMAAAGWGPEIMSGTGPTANPLYAAVFIKASPIPLTRNALTASDFNSLNQSPDEGRLHSSLGGCLGRSGQPALHRHLGGQHRQSRLELRRHR